MNVTRVCLWRIHVDIWQNQYNIVKLKNKKIKILKKKKTKNIELCSWASLVVQMVKSLPAMQETQVQSLGQEDPLKKELATHSSILAWRIPWTEEEPGGPRSMGPQRVG